MKLFLPSPLSLLVCGATLFASLPTLGAERSCNSPSVFRIPQISEVSHTSSFSDAQGVLEWCRGLIADLDEAFDEAEEQAAQEGNLLGGADIIRDALQKKFDAVGIPNPMPNTMDAIRVGLAVANATYEGTANMNYRLKSQVRYLMMGSIYEMVKDAYSTLDNRFYREVYDACRGNRWCRGDGNPENSYLPPSYYDAIRKLGLKVLDFQVQLASYQADDTLELNISQAVVSGAKEILLSSVLRRTLACSISRLDSLERQINRYLSCEGSNLSGRAKVQHIRPLIKQARNSLEQSGCEYTPPPYRRER